MKISVCHLRLVAKYLARKDLLTLSCANDDVEYQVLPELKRRLKDVDDFDKLENFAQDIFDATYRPNSRKYSKVGRRINTQIFIQLYNTETKQKDWVLLLRGKNNMASDFALRKVIKVLDQFKLSLRAKPTA